LVRLGTQVWSKKRMRLVWGRSEEDGNLLERGKNSIQSKNCSKTKNFGT